MEAQSAREPLLAARPQTLAAATARLRALARWWMSHPVAARDSLLAAVFTVLAFAAPLSRIGSQFGYLPSHGGAVVGVLVTLGQTVPLAARTRWPGVCLALTGTSFALHEVLGRPMTFGTLGLYIALYSAVRT